MPMCSNIIIFESNNYPDDACVQIFYILNCHSFSNNYDDDAHVFKNFFPLNCCFFFNNTFINYPDDTHVFKYFFYYFELSFLTAITFHGLEVFEMFLYHYLCELTQQKLSKLLIFFIQYDIIFLLLCLIYW